MNKKLLFLALIGVACLQSCDKLKTSTPLTVDWDGIDVTITVPPVTDTTVQSSLGTGVFSYNIDSLIKDKSKNLLSINDIDSVKVKYCTLTILNPDAGNNGQNFKSGHISFYTDIKPTSMVIGDIPEYPDLYTDTIPCPKMPRNILKEYFGHGVATIFNYELIGQVRHATTHDLNIKVHVAYALYGIMKAN